MYFFALLPLGAGLVLTTRFDWDSDVISHYWVRLYLMPWCLLFYRLLEQLLQLWLVLACWSDPFHTSTTQCPNTLPGCSMQVWKQITLEHSYSLVFSISQDIQFPHLNNRGHSCKVPKSNSCFCVWHSYSMSGYTAQNSGLCFESCFFSFLLIRCDGCCYCSPHSPGRTSDD